MAIHKAQTSLVFLHGANEAARLAELAAQPGQNTGENRVAAILIERLIALTTEGLRSLIAGRNGAGGPLNQFKGLGIAHLRIVSPTEQPVAFDQHTLRLGVLATERFELEGQGKARVLPREPEQFSAVNGADQPCRIVGRSDGEERLR